MLCGIARQVLVVFVEENLVTISKMASLISRCPSNPIGGFRYRWGALGSLISLHAQVSSMNGEYARYVISAQAGNVCSCEFSRATTWVVHGFPTFSNYHEYDFTPPTYLYSVCVRIFSQENGGGLKTWCDM